MDSITPGKLGNMLLQTKIRVGYSHKLAYIHSHYCMLMYHQLIGEARAEAFTNQSFLTYCAMYYMAWNATPN